MSSNFPSILEGPVGGINSMTDDNSNVLGQESFYQDDSSNINSPTVISQSFMSGFNDDANLNNNSNNNNLRRRKSSVKYLTLNSGIPLQELTNLTNNNNNNFDQNLKVQGDINNNNNATLENNEGLMTNDAGGHSSAIATKNHNSNTTLQLTLQVWLYWI